MPATASRERRRYWVLGSVASEGQPFVVADIETFCRWRGNPATKVKTAAVLRAGRALVWNTQAGGSTSRVLLPRRGQRAGLVLMYCEPNDEAGFDAARAAVEEAKGIERQIGRLRVRGDALVISNADTCGADLVREGAAPARTLIAAARLRPPIPLHSRAFEHQGLLVPVEPGAYVVTAGAKSGPSFTCRFIRLEAPADPSKR